MRACGSVVRVRECLECETARLGSGEYAHPHAGEDHERGPAFCEGRSCWLCARRKSQKLRAWLEHASAAIELPERTRWGFLTLSYQYDKADPDEVSVEGLRARARGAKAGLAAVVRAGLANGTITAAFASLELEGHGFLHVHALLASRWLDLDWIDRTARDASGRDVHVWLEAADEGTPREVAKYVAKLISPLDEAALRGEVRSWIHPELMARWELASHGLRLREAYGALRGAQGPERAAHELLDDRDRACEACGVVGSWKTALRGTRAWAIEAHERGGPALVGSIQRERRERLERAEWAKVEREAKRLAPRVRAR